MSDAFLQAVQENTRKYYWTGKITTKNGVVYDFGAEDIDWYTLEDALVEVFYHQE